METTSNKNKMNDNELGIADLLCSAGYLPPRNEQDIDRFERLYRGRKFETETYTINASVIFDKVTSEGQNTIRKCRPITTIFDHPGALRVADAIITDDDNIVAKTIDQLINEKKY